MPLLVPSSPTDAATTNLATAIANSLRRHATVVPPLPTRPSEPLQLTALASSPPAHPPRV